MAGINRTTGKATDLITFSRSSRGTALRKISYGSELVTNGGFDADTSGWTAYNGASASVASGQVTVTNGVTDYGRISQAITCEVGKTYKAQADFISKDAAVGAASLRIHTLPDGNSSVAQANSLDNEAKTLTIYFVATASTMYIQLLTNDSDDGVSTTWDNATVKEVLFDQPDGTLTLFNHPTNIPRIEYAADGTVKGLLIEESRTNLLTYSEDFTNASWGKFGTSSLAIDATGPDGQTSAVTLVDNGSGGAGFVFLRRTVSSLSTSSPYTFSIFAKASGLGWLNIRSNNFTTPPDATDVSFDLLNNNVETKSPNYDSAKIEPFGNGWYRCSVTFTTDVADTSGTFDIFVGDQDGVSTVDLDGTSSILIYGAQFEAGSFPTSYIPTSGATATRAADIASISVDNFGENGGKYSLLLEAVSLAPDNGAGTGNNSNSLAQLSTTPLANYSSLGISSSSFRVNRPSLVSRSDGGTVVSAGDLLALDNTFDEGLSVKFSASFDVDSGTITGSVNGSAVFSATGSVAGVALPFTDISLQKGQGAAYIKSIDYYPRRLSNAQLVQLTA